MRIHPLLASADRGEAICDDGVSADVPPRARGARASSLDGMLAEEDGDPNDLVRQRWGLIVPDGAHGDARVAALTRLIERRAEGQEAEVTILRFPEGAEPASWCEARLGDEAMRERERPRYLLVAADLDEIPLSLHGALGTRAFVGRVAFEDDAALAAWAEKVAVAAPPARAPLRFFVTDDGTRATAIGNSELVAPTLARCEEALAYDELRATEARRLTSARQLFGGEARGGALLSVHHGAGPPRSGWSSVEVQRAEQGAVVAGVGQVLAPERFARGPFVRDGAWLQVSARVLRPIEELRHRSGDDAAGAKLHVLDEIPRLARDDGGRFERAPIDARGARLDAPHRLRRPLQDSGRQLAHRCNPLPVGRHVHRLRLVARRPTFFVGGAEPQRAQPIAPTRGRGEIGLRDEGGVDDGGAARRLRHLRAIDEPELAGPRARRVEAHEERAS